MSSKNKSIQEKTAELTELVAWFDSDEFTLESAIDKFKEAEKLADDIEHDLSSLKNEIKIVKQKFDSGI
jgi:exodeoxyribonuclease VII small subunit